MWRITNTPLALLSLIFLISAFFSGFLHAKKVTSGCLGEYCCCLVAKLCLTLCDTMDCSISGFPVLYHLSHHRNLFGPISHSVVSDSLRHHEPLHARPPCLSPTPGVHPNPCPLCWWCHPAISSPSPPALNLSQQQGFFKWVSSSNQVAKLLEFQLQHQSFQWTLRTDLL